jgi:predicted Rossmann-fold nucleotide-binding protein
MESNVKPLTLIEVAEAAKKRVALISQEFEKGFDFLLMYPRSVTIFGSTRLKPDDLYSKKAYNISKRIVDELHYSVVTGGGPGIMDAANHGAYDAGGNSLGLTIDLPKHQDTNKHLTDEINFHYFLSRKV